MSNSLGPLSRRALVLLVLLGLMAAMASQAAAAKKGNPADRSRVEFAGYVWDVKSSNGLVGPGPNVFSDRNVRVDRRGDLHLQIRERRGQWTSAEVILAQPLGHGTYSFEVRTPIGSLDPNAVFGMFTWSDDPVEHHREIDMEFSRFGDPNATANAHYVVQPYTTPGNTETWSMPDVGTSQHQFQWSQDQIGFSSSAGGQPLHSWSYTGPAAIPTPGDARARINLWLFRGQPPLDGRPIEVVISDFKFTPAA